MINILDVILHLFKNLNKVALRRLIIFQILAEIITSIFIGNNINFVAERLKKQYEGSSSTHMAVVGRLDSLCHVQREGTVWETDLEQDTDLGTLNPLLAWLVIHKMQSSQHYPPKGGNVTPTLLL